MDAFTTPVTNSTNKYGEAFVMPKQTVQIIIPTVVLIVGQNIVAQRDMKGILCRRQLGKRGQIVNDGLQGSFAGYMGPSLVVIPTINCNLIAGDPCLIDYHKNRAVST